MESIRQRMNPYVQMDYDGDYRIMSLRRITVVSSQTSSNKLESVFILG